MSTGRDFSPSSTVANYQEGRGPPFVSRQTLEDSLHFDRHHEIFKMGGNPLTYYELTQSDKPFFFFWGVLNLVHRCSAYRCVGCNFMQIISIFSSLFTDYPHMPTPRRNHTIRLLLQYLDEEASAPPLLCFSPSWRWDSNLPFASSCLCLSVSQYRGPWDPLEN